MYNYLKNYLNAVKLWCLILIEIANNRTQESTGPSYYHDPSLSPSDTLDLKPCPFCGSIPNDVSELMEDFELDSYTIHGAFPVACLNPECPVPMTVDNKSWNTRAPERLVVEELKDVCTKYVQKNDDIIVLPAHYLQQVGLTEEYFIKKGIKVIIFPDKILLKPAIIKTYCCGYNQYP